MEKEEEAGIGGKSSGTYGFISWIFGDFIIKQPADFF